MRPCRPAPPAPAAPPATAAAILSTPASHHWSPASAAAVNSPRTSLPSTAMRPSTSAATRWPRPNRAAASCVVNGTRVRAYLPSSSPSGSAAPSVKDRGHTDRNGDTDTVAQKADVLDGHPPRLPGERHRERALGLAQPFQPATDIVCGAPLGDLGLCQRPKQPQQVGHTLGVAGCAVLAEVLQLCGGAGDHLRVEQFAHLDLAEQFAEQRGVDRQCGCASFGERQVALVHERADVAEQQVARERRRLLGSSSRPPDASLCDSAGQPQQSGHSVDILQHLAQGLQEDRERRCRRATSSSCAERWRCCHRGLRLLGLVRGMRSARAAHSRNREAKRADPPTSAMTICSDRSASKTNRSAPGGSAADPERAR